MNLEVTIICSLFDNYAPTTKYTKTNPRNLVQHSRIRKLFEKRWKRVPSESRRNRSLVLFSLSLAVLVDRS